MKKKNGKNTTFDCVFCWTIYFVQKKKCVNTKIFTTKIIPEMKKE